MQLSEYMRKGHMAALDRTRIIFIYLFFYDFSIKFCKCSVFALELEVFGPKLTKKWGNFGWNFSLLLDTRRNVGRTR